MDGQLPRYHGLRVLQVLRTHALTPRMRRLVLGGPEIEGIKDGPNLKLLIPPEGLPAPKWPLQGADGRPLWPEAPERPIVRTYSVRRLDRAKGELFVDFVLHGAGGVAAGFAARAVPGDMVGIGGPGGRDLPLGDFHLLAGDQSGLPSIAAILERLPANAVGAAFIEVPDAAEELDLVRPAGVRLVYLHRAGAAAGTTTLLQDAVTSMPWPITGRVCAWVAAESASARLLRTYLRDTRHLPPRDLVVVGYWKRGMSENAYQQAHDHDRDADYHRAAAEEHAA
ncbi:siderophore-interacting protein [Aquabacter cavernae]|uniref:siderophore-interacting protein n=1 Tax=Aquabacter cavernae TaxID=2496029 RepID=UPI000F8D1409|nr:siderophore-interacting protein [Aquabacter cavernae]